MKNDELGSRMKDNYETRTRYFLPRRTYTIIRLDGKAFHTFTKGFKRPFDYNLMSMMDQTGLALANLIQGVKFCYVQSDEISLLLTDFEMEKTDAWYDGNIQKISSVSASIATAAFNKELLILEAKKSENWYEKVSMSLEFLENLKTAHFDSRVFTIPDLKEVINYFIWRQKDATRNSIQMAAQSVYSHKELHGKNTDDLQEMLFQKGINWNNYPSAAKRGRAIVKEQYLHQSEVNRENRVEMTQEYPQKYAPVLRSRWTVLTGMDGKPETPIFTQEPQFLLNVIPRIGNED
jgi:tRNA(His) 5'-end guanylyltransferase